MNRIATDLLLERMFQVRRVSLWAVTVFVALLLVPYFCVLFPEARQFLLTEFDFRLRSFALRAVAVVIVGGAMATGYYVFRVGRSEGSMGYALGHLLLFTGLACPLLPAAILFVPLLLRCDIERWRRWEDEALEEGEAAIPQAIARHDAAAGGSRV